MAWGSSYRLARRAGILVCCVVLFLAVASSALAAGPWNLSTDFLARGDSAAPSVKDADGATVWYFKYGGSATGVSGFQQQTAPTNAWDIAPPVPVGLKGWDHLQYPLISINGTGGDIPYVNRTTPAPFTWPAGAVRVHPGPAGSGREFSVIEFKSPTAGDAAVTVALSDLDVYPGQNGFEYWILDKNAAELGHQAVAEGGSDSRSINHEVAAGDSIYLVVGSGGASADSYYYDSIRVDFQVAVAAPPVVSTPASATWSVCVLLFLGAAALVVRKPQRAN